MGSPGFVCWDEMWNRGTRCEINFCNIFFFLIEIGIDNVAVSERNFERKIIRDAIDFEEELFYLRSDTVESLFLDNRYLSTRLLIKLKRN